VRRFSYRRRWDKLIFDLRISPPQSPESVDLRQDTGRQVEFGDSHTISILNRMKKETARHGR
jgi:hypothetical protein